MLLQGLSPGLRRQIGVLSPGPRQPLEERQEVEGSACPQASVYVLVPALLCIGNGTSGPCLLSLGTGL